MDNLVREGEQALEGGGGNNQGNMGGGNMDQQSQGNMGGGNNNQQSQGNQSSGGGGGGFMGGLEKTGKDAMIDQEINQFATKEGVPSAVDGVLDQMVNKEL